MKNTNSTDTVKSTASDARYVRMTQTPNDLWFPLWELCDVLGLINEPVTSRLKPDWLGRESFPSLFGQESLRAVCQKGAHELTFCSDTHEAKLLRKWLEHHPDASQGQGLLFQDTVCPALKDDNRHMRLVNRDLQDIGMRFKRVLGYINFCCRHSGLGKDLDRLKLIGDCIDKASACLRQGGQYLKRASMLTDEANEL